MIQPQRTIYLIGRDVIEPLALIFLRQTLPVQLSRLQHTQRSHHIRASKSKRILDRTIHMALCCQMNNAIHFLLLHQRINRVKVADIGLHKTIIRLILYVLQVSQIAGISQLVYIDNAILWILVDKKSYHMATNKSGTAGNNNSFHIIV